MTNDHDVEPPFSIQSIISRASSSTSDGTVSTATSLIASFAGQLSLEERVAIKSHNSSNQQTIRSELTGEEKVKKDDRRHGGMYLAMGYVSVIVSIVPSDVSKGDVFKTSASNKMESTSLINHLISDHFGLTQSRQQDPTYKTKYPGGENEYNEQFFQNCITTESKLHLDKYEQEQNDINKMNKLPFTRESFLDLFTDFVIANNLPMKLVKEKLKQQKYINFTTDLWKSETNQYFMGITAHFIDQKWEPQQITIALKHMKNASHAEAYRLTINSEDELREDCSLNNAQIEYIINIQKILTKFENITSWLSSQQYTTINKTIVLYNDLFTRLEKFQQKNPSLSAAIDLCITKLSKYYSRTDRTDVYACATMVDPSLKFSYWYLYIILCKYYCNGQAYLSVTFFRKVQEWETDIIEEQISRCEKSFSSFLADYYTHELRTSNSSEALAFRIEAGKRMAIYMNEKISMTVESDDGKIGSCS
ncbi:hypothetical protein EDC94DRAFT_591179 [Helicostylum pulchrum]|nr:hypothetical protein EDC94DRAFT_591179 [Helicostylum pulchrum]